MVRGKTVSTNGQEYEGVYENGQLIKGAFSSNINGDLWTYKGEFNGNYFQGVGIERREVNNQIIIKEGDFFQTNYIKVLKPSYLRILVLKLLVNM
jgi:hypothetical protein